MMNILTQVQSRHLKLCQQQMNMIKQSMKQIQQLINSEIKLSSTSSTIMSSSNQLVSPSIKFSASLNSSDFTELERRFSSAIDSLKDRSSADHSKKKLMVLCATLRTIIQQWGTTRDNAKEESELIHWLINSNAISIPSYYCSSITDVILYCEEQMKYCSFKVKQQHEEYQKQCNAICGWLEVHGYTREEYLSNQHSVTKSTSLSISSTSPTSRFPSFSSLLDSLLNLHQRLLDQHYCTVFNNSTPIQLPNQQNQENDETKRFEHATSQITKVQQLLHEEFKLYTNIKVNFITSQHAVDIPLKALKGEQMQAR